MGWEVAGDRKHELGFFHLLLKKKEKRPQQREKNGDKSKRQKRGVKKRDKCNPNTIMQSIHSFCPHN